MADLHRTGLRLTSVEADEAGQCPAPAAEYHEAGFAA